ncbi:Uncharacterised protein [Escherichia coli]|uniref:Uncharacterized protein n=1 Tax=Escherichia coli TaxID=562 RepID=A0A376RJ90_ECOLX|nr:Uncharacterised protein [Escherichia coli]
MASPSANYLPHHRAVGDVRADIRVRLLLYGGVERLSVCVDLPLQRQQFHLTGGPERAVQYARLHLGTDDGGLTGDRIAGGDMYALSERFIKSGLTAGGVKG